MTTSWLELRVRDHHPEARFCNASGACPWRPVEAQSLPDCPVLIQHLGTRDMLMLNAHDWACELWAWLPGGLITGTLAVMPDVLVGRRPRTCGELARLLELL